MSEPRSSGQEPTPITIGPWRILHELGEGGMARVLLAERELATGHTKIAVVKVPKERYLVDEKHREAFFAEADLAMKLDHPNIVPVFDAGVDEGLPYFAMMFVSGKSLSEVIRDRSRHHIDGDCEVAAYVTLQVAYALQYAHEFEIAGVHQQIIHRDVSAKNVMVGGDGSVLLSDFGVASALSHETSGHAVKGTLVYMAPEHALGHATQKSDAFGVGTILWMLLGGRRFRGDVSGDEVMPAVIRGYIPDVGRPDVPADLRRVLDGLLDPEERDRMPLAEAIPILEQYPSRRTALTQIMRRMYGRDARRSGRTRADRPVAKAVLATKALAKTREAFLAAADPYAGLDDDEDPAPPTIDVRLPAALRDQPNPTAAEVRGEHPPAERMADRTRSAAPSDETVRFGERTPPARADTTAPLAPAFREADAPVLSDAKQRQRVTEVDPMYAAPGNTAPAPAATAVEEITRTSAGLAAVRASRAVRPLPRIFVRRRLLAIAKFVGLGLGCVTIGSVSVALYLKLSERSDPTPIEDVAWRSVEAGPTSPAGAELKGKPGELVIAEPAEETAADAQPEAADPRSPLAEPMFDPEAQPTPEPATEPTPVDVSTAREPPPDPTAEAAPVEAKSPRDAAAAATRKPVAPRPAAAAKTIVVKLGLGFVEHAEVRIDGRTHKLRGADKKVTIKLRPGAHRVKWRTSVSDWTSTQWSLQDGCEYFVLVDAKATKLSKTACGG